MNHLHPILASLLIALALQAEDFTYTGSPRLDPPLLVRDAPAPAVGERLRIASYNIENFTDAQRDGTNRTAAMFKRQAEAAAALVRRIDPDVLLIQEIENSNSLTALNRALDGRYPVAAITRFGDRAKGEDKLNIAVLARHPIAEFKELDFAPLTGNGRPTRGFLRLQLDLGEGTRLLVYGVHLKSNFGHGPRNIAQRKAALELLRRDAESLKAAQAEIRFEVLVLGDTNVDPESPQFAQDTSFAPLDGWIDVWKGRPLAERTTMPTRKGIPGLEFPPVTFDRFFVTPELNQRPWQVAGVAALQEGVDTADASAEPGSPTHVSDHYPVYIDLVR